MSAAAERPLDSRAPRGGASSRLPLEERDHTPGIDSVWKEATLENGIRVMVPPFVDVGEAIRVDVETGRYVERARGKR